MTADDVYHDVVTRCCFVLELAPNSEIDADRSEMAVGAIVEGDDGAFIALEVGISALGEPYALVRISIAMERFRSRQSSPRRRERW